MTRGCMGKDADTGERSAGEAATGRRRPPAEKSAPAPWAELGKGDPAAAAPLEGAQAGEPGRRCTTGGRAGSAGGGPVENTRRRGGRRPRTAERPAVSEGGRRTPGGSGPAADPRARQMGGKAVVAEGQRPSAAGSGAVLRGPEADLGRRLPGAAPHGGADTTLHGRRGRGRSRAWGRAGSSRRRGSRRPGPDACAAANTGPAGCATRRWPPGGEGRRRGVAGARGRPAAARARQGAARARSVVASAEATATRRRLTWTRRCHLRQILVGANEAVGSSGARKGGCGSTVAGRWRLRGLGALLARLRGMAGSRPRPGGRKGRRQRLQGSRPGRVG
jgi:hypothetical protein